MFTVCLYPFDKWIGATTDEKLEGTWRGVDADPVSLPPHPFPVSRYRSTHVAPIPIVLGPILFVLYTADLVQLIETFGLSPHLYADDTQVCGSCAPTAVALLASQISECVDAVAAWMQAAVKSSQDWGPMVCNKPSSSSATNDSNADRRRSSYPGIERPRPWYLYRRWPFHADACSENDFELFRCSPPDMSDPSIGTNGHISDADGRPCQPTAGLWEQHTGRHSSLLNEQAAVSIERCRMANFPSQTLRPHYWCSSVYTGCVCRSEFNSESPCWHTESTTATHHGIWGHSPLLLMSLVEERCVLPELTVWSCLQ